jgi:hypothetical protein
LNRRLFNRAVGLSLLLSIVTIGVAIFSFRSRWVIWSYHLGTYVSGRGTATYGIYDDNRYFLDLSRGVVFIGYENQHLPPSPKLITFLKRMEGVRTTKTAPFGRYGKITIPIFQGLGFKYGIWWMGNAEFGRGLIIPLWFITGIFALLPLLALNRWRTRPQRRLAAGLCAVCGYDLTANVSGVCPECGAARKAASTAVKC